jgi:hypothetical protein
MEAEYSQMNIISTDFTANQLIIEASINIFTQKLKDEWKFKRTPRKLKERLLRTPTLESTATARIFLEYGGFQPWVTHFLVTEGQAHFAGRHHRTTTLADFDKLSSVVRANVATRVANVQPHPTTITAVQKIFKALSSDGK